MFLNQFLLNRRKTMLQIDLLKFFFRVWTRSLKQTAITLCLAVTFRIGVDCLHERDRYGSFVVYASHFKENTVHILPIFQHTRKKKRVKHKGVGEGRRANRVYLAKSSVLRWRLISRNSIRALNDRIKIREKRGLWTRELFYSRRNILTQAKFSSYVEKPKRWIKQEDYNDLQLQACMWKT